LSVAVAHAPAPAANLVPEYTVAMTITAPANGTNYVAGEQPTIKATLKNKADGTDVATSFYTSAKHATGTTSATALSKASLYIYGPRANAKPVLTSGASITPIPTQGVSLFIGSTYGTPAVVDPKITTDATGFSYKVTIPTTMAAGTYMVRFIAANYGYVSDTNFKIDSTAFTTIQIGTATVEQKVSGNACVDCHGAGTLGAHDARHSVVFDTDQCLSCHDYSGNHGDTIENRVHAIHAESQNGDLMVINWSSVPTAAYTAANPTTPWVKPVTYPQGEPSYDANGNMTATGAPRCITCHTSTSTAYLTVVTMKNCIGCHADKPGAIGHFQANGN
jgi:hypothetical protein